MGDAERIFEFALVVKNFRGWAFTMRPRIHGDEWSAVELLLARELRRRDRTMNPGAYLTKRKHKHKASRSSPKDNETNERKDGAK